MKVKSEPKSYFMTFPETSADVSGNVMQ